MTTTTDRTDALAERLFAATLGALELHSVYLGAELGLYRTLDTHGPLTAEQLAERAGIAPRYAVEWLEQQAVAGLLEHQDGRFRLAADYARVLCHADDPAHVAPFAHMLTGIGAAMPRVTDAYRSGGGVPYQAYGRAFRHGQGHINRPADALAAAHDALAPGGAVLVVDERVADAYSAPGDEVERMMYGWSVTHCLPTQLAEQPSAALGTVLRSHTVRELAARAGYARVDVLPVDNDFFRLYRLHA